MCTNRFPACTTGGATTSASAATVFRPPASVGRLCDYFAELIESAQMPVLCTTKEESAP